MARRLVGAVAVTAALAACSTSDDSASTTESPGTVVPAPTAVATADTNDTGTSDTVDPSAAEGSPDLTATWLVVREVVKDNGVFGADYGAEARVWNLTCADADCAVVEVDSAPIGLGSDLPPVTATFDGTHLTLKTDELVSCFDPKTNDFTGPEVTRSYQTIELDVTARDGSGMVTSMTGTETSGESTPESAAPECKTGETSETSDMVMFRPDLTVGTDPPTGVVRGGQSLTKVQGDELGPDAPQAADKGTFEYRILPCEGEACDFIVRLRLSPSESLFDIPVNGDPEGGYTGSAKRFGDCQSDTTGAILSEESFRSTTSVTLKVYAVEGGEVVSIELVDDLTPTAESFAADPVNCYPAVFTSEFLGRVVDDPVDQFEGIDTVRIPQDLPPEINAEGEILFRETVAGFIMNTVRAYGVEQGHDVYVIAEAFGSTYGIGLSLVGSEVAADPRSVSFLSSFTGSSKDLPSAENQYMVAVAVADTTGSCLGVVIYGFPTPSETFTADNLAECTAQAVSEVFLTQL